VADCARHVLTVSPGACRHSVVVVVGWRGLPGAASDGQLTLTEIAPSAITPTDDISTHVITPKLEKTEEDDDDVSAQEYYEVPATSELAATNLEMIVECAGTT